MLIGGGIPSVGGYVATVNAIPFGYLQSGATYPAPASGSTFSVLVSESNGCSGLAEMVVPAHPGLLSATGNVTDVVCSTLGSIDLTITGGYAPLSFAWSNGTATEDLSNLSAGNYTCIITDAIGCTFVYAAAVADVSQNPVLNPISVLDLLGHPNDNALCHSGNFELDAQVQFGTGQLPYTFTGTADPIAPISFIDPNSSFTQAATSNTTNDALSNTVTVIVTDDNGCMDTASVLLTIAPDLAFS